jgi:hypothetical protein
MGLATGCENNETNDAAIPTRDEQHGSLQLSGNHVLPCIPVPINAEHIRLAADLTVFDVTLAYPHGSVHHCLVPLTTSRTLEA